MYIRQVNTQVQSMPQHMLTLTSSAANELKIGLITFNSHSWDHEKKKHFQTIILTCIDVSKPAESKVKFSNGRMGKERRVILKFTC